MSDDSEDDIEGDIEGDIEDNADNEARETGYAVLGIDNVLEADYLPLKTAACLENDLVKNAFFASEQHCRNYNLHVHSGDIGEEVTIHDQIRMTDVAVETVYLYDAIAMEVSAIMLFGIYGVLEPRATSVKYGSRNSDRSHIRIFPPPELFIFAVDTEYTSRIVCLTQMTTARSIPPLMVCKLAQYDRYFGQSWFESGRVLSMLRGMLFSGRMPIMDTVTENNLMECLYGTDPDVQQTDIYVPNAFTHNVTETGKNIWMISGPTRFSELFAYANRIVSSLKPIDALPAQQQGDPTVQGASPVRGADAGAQSEYIDGQPRKYIVLGHYLPWLLTVKLQLYYATLTGPEFFDLVFDKRTAWMNIEFMNIFDQLHRLRSDLASVVQIEVGLSMVTTSLLMPSLDFFILWEECGRPGMSSLYNTMREFIESGGEITRKQRYSAVLGRRM
jgi:hypothetical protein